MFLRKIAAALRVVRLAGPAAADGATMSSPQKSTSRPNLFPRVSVAIVSVGVAMIVLASAGWAHGQLANPGFEDSGGSLAGWQIFNNTAGNVTVTSTTPHTGSWAASLSGPSSGGGGTSYSGITQGLETTSGVVWTASAYVRHNSGFILEDDNQLLMKIEFYRRFGGLHGTADFIDEVVIAGLDIRTSSSRWHRITLSAVAPPDAVEARVAFVFVQHGSDGGTALVDDVSLTAVDGEVGPPEGVAWWLFWHDEFDGDSVDETKWSVFDGHIVKNGELQYYDPEDVYLENGRLVLRSRKHDPPVIRQHPDGYEAEFEYTSGLVETPGLFSHTYGWIEVRAKLPSTQGIWPAHWMLGDSFPEIGWPRCGEIDIMELLGHEPETVYFTRHWGDPYEYRGTSHTGPDFSQDFHTFALRWTADTMSWYVDGLLRYETSIIDAGSIYWQPFYLILNTAVGGYWPGFPNLSTVFPQYHEIEYVRWYVESDPGDFDRDGDVDADDQAAFADCYGGSDSQWTDPACRFFDMDADDDVDCDDWISFTEAWTGSTATEPFFWWCHPLETRRVGGRRTAG
jgi:beta-glucanase (GH16 family)